MPSDEVRQYGSATEVGRLLECDPKQVPRLASKGLITVRRLPGCAPRYLLADAERLAAETTRPASAVRNGV